MCGTGGLEPDDVGARSRERVGRLPAEPGRDHRVERAVRDRDRDAHEASGVERAAVDPRQEARQRDDRRRPRPARAEAQRAAHHRALREAAEDDAVHRHRQPVEECRELWRRRVEGRRVGRRDPAERVPVAPPGGR